MPEVERLKDEAEARGDLSLVRNAEHLLTQWQALISTYTPANDLYPPRQSRTKARAQPRQLPPRRAVALLLTDLAEVLKRNVGALWLAFRDDRTPWYAKAIAALACFLAVSPVDLTPDRIPHIGFLDDPTIFVVGTLLAAELISPLLIAEFRERAASVEHSRAMRGSLVLCSICGAALLATILHMWRPVV